MSDQETNTSRGKTWMLMFKVLIVIHLMIQVGQSDAMLHYTLEKPKKSQSVSSQKVSKYICWEGLDTHARPLSSVLCNSTHKIYPKLAARALIRRFTQFLSCSMGLIISVIA